MNVVLVLVTFLFPFLALGNSALVAEYNRASNASLLWAPYRSNLYFGVKPRGLPNSLMTGLMWYEADTVQGIQHLRHSCETGDPMQGFGWTSYDPRLGGTQVIRDRQNNVDITTEFVKNDEGHWATRIKGKPLKKDAKIAVVIYAGLEGEGTFDLASELTPSGISGDVRLRGKTPDLGKFDLTITEGPEANRHPVMDFKPLKNERPGDKSHYATLNVPDGFVWQAKDIFLTLAQDSVAPLADKYADEEDLPPWSLYLMANDNSYMHGRMHYVQKVFEGEFEFDIIYNNKATKSASIKPEHIDDMSKSIASQIDAKFQSAFTFQAPYDTEDYIPFGKELYSNLVGGMGYFYGNQLVDRGDKDEEEDEEFWEVQSETRVVEEGPYELLTLVPSRPFFPRGFYWDEGFELIPVLEYDADIVLDIMKSWFSLVDSDGWIAREQILGPEARSKVPEQFQVQYPNVANPPTLMLLLSRIVQKVRDTNNPDFFEYDPDATSGIKLGSAHLEIPELLLGYVKQIYPKLQLHFEWFRTSQRGSIKEWDREAFSMKEGYRWRGRTPNHCLASGLDDYPRAKTPHTGELHVDLISWVGMMARALKDFADVAESVEDREEYSQIENAIINNIEDLHWVEEEQCYCDQTIDDYGENQPVCHKGYVSLFPLLLKLIPDDKIEDRVIPLIKLIRDPEQLWSPYGIRSLSKSDEYYGTEEDYWRSPIWININYMVLESLQYYSQRSSAVRKAANEVYKELRQNIVNNVYDNWKRTGFAWEQYDAETGRGRGVRHFLGWTSLVVNIMGMPESL
uniref:Mannosyl-oligosaccharide glucosidase n=1 Tax=Blastobotrys adeninivorans TaxID=409370 RepID=A0A060T494_BLAAD